MANIQAFCVLERSVNAMPDNAHRRRVKAWIRAERGRWFVVHAVMALAGDAMYWRAKEWRDG